MQYANIVPQREQKARRRFGDDAKKDRYVSSGALLTSNTSGAGIHGPSDAEAPSLPSSGTSGDFFTEEIEPMYIGVKSQQGKAAPVADRQSLQ